MLALPISSCSMRHEKIRGEGGANGSLPRHLPLNPHTNHPFNLQKSLEGRQDFRWLNRQADTLSFRTQRSEVRNLRSLPSTRRPIAGMVSWQRNNLDYSLPPPRPLSPATASRPSPQNPSPPPTSPQPPTPSTTHHPHTSRTGTPPRSRTSQAPRHPTRSPVSSPPYDTPRSPTG